jgi:hypoxanthine-DNA glycosylase
MQITSFPWLINANCNQLILGSIPGLESLRIQQYYAHPQNQFWRLLYDLHGQPMNRDYEERKAFLLSKRTALWDVVSHCEREGSLDTNILYPVMNDFVLLFKEYPNIRSLFFNGGKAFDLFKRHVAPSLKLIEYSFHKLPSSSPAHTLSYENKLNEWKVILTH